MSILNKYQEGKQFTYDKDEERDFTSFKELANFYNLDKVYPVRALFINTKSKFGDAPVIYTDGYIVNAPQHLTDTVKEMSKDTELVDMVNDGKVGFKLYEYKNSYGKAYGLEWQEI